MSSCPVDHSSLPDKCPVDHKATQPGPSIWSRFVGKSSTETPPPVASTSSTPQPLSQERDVSSIPKASSDGGNWVYPSEAQFFSAMARKNHNPQASDMKTIVPIHNAVNERAWTEVMKWEAGRGGDKCGGVKLFTFKGNPGKKSPRARWRTLLGYSPPFDRHDWVVDRCGTKLRYVIDFYTGHSQQSAANNLSFYLDVRPALDNWEGVKMRMENFWYKWFPATTKVPSST